MKKKRLFALLLVVLLLTGCGAKSMDAANGAAAAQVEEVYYEAADSISLNTSASASESGNVEQKLIKRVSMNAETEDLDALLAQLSQKISDLGGYVEYQELYNGSAYSSYRYRSANLTIRIPAARLGEFTEQVQGVSNVVSYNESQDDVTLTYVDTESRMNALKVEEERLLELLSKAENMSDLLEIEARLTDVRYELESTTSQLRVLENQVSYATVELNIDQVKVYTEVEEQTVWQRIGSGFQKNLRGIGDDLVDFFVWVVTYSPQLLFWVLVIAGAVFLLRRKLRNSRKQKQTVVPPEKEE